MRKFVVMGFCLLVATGLNACHSGQPQDQTEDQTEDSSLAVKTVETHISEAMAAKMNDLLKNYYTLKDAFVESDTSAANQAAILLKAAVAALPLDELKSAETVRYDSARTAVGSLQSEIEGLLGETTKEGKRAEFRMISDMTYDLIHSIGLKEQTVYREFCPMADNGKGAYWLSNSQTIRNPYYGHEMLTCGEVKEALKF